MSRECGPCNRCCFTCSVEEFGKQAHSRCDHQTKTGCAIYADRPHSCQKYSCAWREGLIPKKGFRPDEFVAMDAYKVTAGGRTVEVFMAYFGNRRPNKDQTKKIKRLVGPHRCVLVCAAGDLTLVAGDRSHQRFADTVMEANDEAFRHSGRDTRTAIARDGSFIVIQTAGSNPATMDDVKKDFPQFFV